MASRTSSRMSRNSVGHQTSFVEWKRQKYRSLNGRGSHAVKGRGSALGPYSHPNREDPHAEGMNKWKKEKGAAIRNVARIEDATGLSRAALEDIAQVFRTTKGDTGLSGYITVAQFKEHFRNALVDDDAILERTFQLFDASKNGRVDFREFCMGFSLALNGTVEDHLRLAFSLFDADGDGYLTSHELFDLLKNNVQESMPDILNLFNIQELDENGDGRISFDEFKAHMADRDPDVVKLLQEIVIDHNQGDAPRRVSAEGY